jgi:hypothetical protein
MADSVTQVLETCPDSNGKLNLSRRDPPALSGIFPIFTIRFKGQRHNDLCIIRRACGGVAAAKESMPSGIFRSDRGGEIGKDGAG